MIWYKDIYSLFEHHQWKRTSCIMCLALHFASGNFVSGCWAIFFSSIGLFSPPVFEPFNIKKKLNHISKKDNLAKVQLLNLKKSQLLLLHRFFIPTHLKFTPDNIFFLNLVIRLSFDHCLVIIIHYYTLLLIIRHQYKFHLVTKFCQEWNLFQMTYNSSELLSQPPEHLE